LANSKSLLLIGRSCQRRCGVKHGLGYFYAKSTANFPVIVPGRPAGASDLGND
jgi:hypothetical protein